MNYSVFNSNSTHPNIQYMTKDCHAGEDVLPEEVENQHEKYYQASKKHENVIPNLIGMPAMDAIAVLENMNFDVKLIGEGNVVNQSIKIGDKLKLKPTVILELL